MIPLYIFKKNLNKKIYMNLNHNMIQNYSKKEGYDDIKTITDLPIILLCDPTYYLFFY